MTMNYICNFRLFVLRIICQIQQPCIYNLYIITIIVIHFIGVLYIGNLYKNIIMLVCHKYITVIYVINNKLYKKNTS